MMSRPTRFIFALLLILLVTAILIAPTVSLPSTVVPSHFLGLGFGLLLSCITALVLAIASLQRFRGRGEAVPLQTAKIRLPLALHTQRC